MEVTHRIDFRVSDTDLDCVLGHRASVLHPAWEVGNGQIPHPGARDGERSGPNVVATQAGKPAAQNAVLSRGFGGWDCLE